MRVAERPIGGKHDLRDYRKFSGVGALLDHIVGQGIRRLTSFDNPKLIPFFLGDWVAANMVPFSIFFFFRPLPPPQCLSKYLSLFPRPNVCRNIYLR